MSDSDDRLLYILSARRDIAWSAFKEAFDRLYLSDNQLLEEPAFHRSKTLHALSGLAHIEFHFGSTGSRVYILPPALICLPQGGLPTGVVTGCRSPALLAEVEKLCSDYRCSSAITEQRTPTPFTPRRIEIRGERIDDLENIATAIGFCFMRTPPAWSLVNFSGSIDELLAGAAWRTGEELNWPRKEFDPMKLQFRADIDNPAELRLIRYTDPKRGTNLHVLRTNSEYFEIDCEWGRYAVLQRLGLNVLIYDERELVLAVPTSVPLPRLLGRALALCSGYAPRWLERSHFRWTTLERRGFDLFTAVPPQIAERLAQCVGQLLVPRPLRVAL